MTDCIQCRVLMDGPAEGAWNMAVDEALLTGPRVVEQGVLRLYQWCQPTLSLGYFQSYQDVSEAERWRDVAVVRRLTGGGAVLHDRELTYSLVLPRTVPFAVRSEPLYDAVHRAIARALGQLGVGTAVRHDREDMGKRQEAGRILEEASPSPARGLPSPEFLCFARTDPHDIIFEGRKIGGSAQRRKRTAVLQHGSIVLQTSPRALDIPGLHQLGGPSVTPEDLVGSLARIIPEALELEAVASTLQPSERAVAEELARSKYRLPWWNERV